MGKVWLALACGILLSCAARETSSSEQEGVLEENEARIVFELPTGESRPVEFMDDGEAHSYPVALKTGDFLHVEIEQRGVDVEVSLADPDGNVLIEVDSPGGTHSTEYLGFVVRETGTFEVMVRPGGALRGRRYSIRAEEPRAADEADVEYGQACEAMSAGDALRAEGSRSSLDLALRHYLRAQRTWLAQGEATQEAIAWHRSAMVWSGLGRAELEEEYYQKSLKVLDLTASQPSQDITAKRVDILLRLAPIYRETARPEKAIEANTEARRLAHEIGNRSIETNALNNLATLSFHSGKYEDALRFYMQTTKVYRELEYPTGLVISLRRTGDVYNLLGKTQEALSAYQESLAVGRDADDLILIDHALIGLGWYHYTQGEYTEALKSFEEIITRSRDREDAVLAGALDRRGSVFFTLKRLEEALASYTEALRIYESLDLVQPQGPVLVNIGQVELVSGRPEKALGVLRRALPLVRRTEDQAAEADTLLNMARAERELGLWDKAVADSMMALDVIEALRSDIRDPDDRLLFLEQPRQSFYEFSVDLLMERALATKDENYAARAFAVAERNRARVLLELLDQSRSDVRQYGPSDLASVQDLIDPDTFCLTFFLGEERSFLWRIGRNAFATYVLPKRKEIEEAALTLYTALRRSSEIRMRGPLRLHAKKLSRMILEGVESSLGHERLIIVADGALQYVPFAALLEPSSSEPLIVDHEIVTLPSASVLDVLRGRKKRAPSSWSVAVIADPVTDRTDERLRNFPEEPDGRDTGLLEYPRLDYSHAEAKKILSLFPPERTLVSEGFDANLEEVLSGTFRSFDVIHFSAHGILDTERPERSAIVLSLFDRDGRPRDGLLRLGEIRGLDLPAELVVLGACSTALGREVHGEGLVGLTRGFMYAGASRVLVSLWDVSDQGTSELMQRFYRAIARDGELPAAALRSAQISMLGDPMFQAPYFWAPFVLQGDWR